MTHPGYSGRVRSRVACQRLRLDMIAARSGTELELTTAVPPTRSMAPVVGFRFGLCQTQNCPAVAVTNVDAAPVAVARTLDERDPSVSNEAPISGTRNVLPMGRLPSSTVDVLHSHTRPAPPGYAPAPVPTELAGGVAVQESTIWPVASEMMSPVAGYVKVMPVGMDEFMAKNRARSATNGGGVPTVK